MVDSIFGRFESCSRRPLFATPPPAGGRVPYRNVGAGGADYVRRAWPIMNTLR